MQKSPEEKAQLEDTRRALLNILEDTEQARRQAEEDRKKIQLIITDLVDGLLVFDEAGRLEVMNPQAEHILQVESATTLGKNLAGLASIDAFGTLLKMLQEEEDRLFRKEFTLREAVLEVTELPFEAGTMLVLHDVTREKEIERMKTEFVSLAAHQLRTPLSAIKWSIQMLLEGDMGPVNAKQKEFLSRTYESNERMITLINDLLNVTRIESGRYLYQPAFVQLEDIIEAQMQLYKGEAERRGIALTFARPKEQCPKALVDPEKIGIVIQNLIDNALHYTSQGGEVTVSASHDTKELRVQVKDTGLGIPKGEQEKIFEKFFRASNVKKVHTEGSGLGLYITRHIVEIHGGKIWFESAEGKGTTFIFTLPIKEEMEEFLKKF
jgi:signal transduction histidine kinase